MTPDELEHRAREASRLFHHEPLLIEALETVRMNALLRLSEVDATNTSEILKYQAIAAVTVEIKEFLEGAILSAPDRDGEPG